MTKLGEAGQKKLKQARVFIAGAGGLGSAVSLYLTAAGVGTIRIVDHDRVELSNLNRQVLYWNGELLINRLLVYGGLSMKFTEFKVRKDPKCRYCGHLTSEGKAD